MKYRVKTRRGDIWSFEDFADAYKFQQSIDGILYVLEYHCEYNPDNK